MPRVCFTLQVDADRLEEYVEAHRAVWPEMLEAIRDAGRRHYSLFLRPDGLLVGCYETDDDSASARALASDPRTAALETQMSQFFIALDGDRPDQGAPQATEIFHLETQLDAAGLPQQSPSSPQKGPS